MNCVANILHKICNASVFFSAYRTCYNSIVKIEQKRKSAFFRGRSFCLEVVEISREEWDVYLIPQNFVDTGTILGGTVKLRNAVEGGCACCGQRSTAVLSAAGVQHPPDDRHCGVGAAGRFRRGRYRR